MVSRLPNPEYVLLEFKGGVDQTTRPLVMPPGRLIDSANVEIGISGGYQMSVGYERFDGRPSPSLAQFVMLGVELSDTVEVDDVVTGVTSSATGTVAVVEDTYLILLRVSGDFEEGEDIQVSAVTVGEATTDGLLGAAETMDLASQYQAIAANDARADIEKPPGEGRILGVWTLGNDVFCARNHTGGAEARIYKATATGWELIELGLELDFTSGDEQIFPGDTIEGMTSSATAEVGAIAVKSGQWSDGDAAGTMIVFNQTGTFEAENLKIGAADDVATIAGDSEQIQLEPDGRYRTRKYNFGGSAGGQKVYGVDGANRGFEFDGEVYFPISTGMEDDRPQHVACFSFHLFFSFQGSVQHSGTGRPHAWSVVTGAGELAMGDQITAMIPLYGYETGSAMAVISRHSTRILYGSSDANWQLVDYRDEIGAYADSVQLAAMTMMLDDRGITTLRQTDAFGNFAHSTLSQLLQPWLRERKGQVVDSCLVRDKNQYRLFFSDGSALYVTMDGTKVRGMMPQYFPDILSCVTSQEDTTGAEVIYYGTADGFVMQAERGTSFDGENKDWFLITHFVNYGNDRMKKRYRKAAIEVSGSGYAEFEFAYELGYNSLAYHQAGAQTKIAEFMASRWDEMQWDNFYWDGVSLTPATALMTGSAENVSYILQGSSDRFEPIQFTGINTRLNARRQIR